MGCHFNSQYLLSKNTRCRVHTRSNLTSPIDINNKLREFVTVHGVHFRPKIQTKLNKLTNTLTKVNTHSRI